MSSLQRVVGKRYKMVIRQSPNKAAEKRRRLEYFQAVDRPIVLASRYNFSPPLTFSLHQKHDPILQAAYPILYKFCYSTFAGYRNPLEIEPLFSDDAVFLHQAMFYGAAASAMYAIGRYGMIAKVRLFINASSGQVFVQDQEKLVGLEDWLTTLPPPVGRERSTTIEGGYESLKAWWLAKGEMFRLMDLPPELWTYIFELAFGLDVYPYYRDNVGNGLSNRKNFRNTKYAPAPTKGILTLNKEIRNALLPFVLKKTCKCFPTSYDLTRYMRYMDSISRKLGHLTEIELDYTNTQYFYFFRVQVAPFLNHPERLPRTGNIGHASVLLQLPALNHLFLRFTAPTDGVEDPWYNTGQFRGFRHRDWESDFRGNYNHYSIGCQKVVVDWILTFAKEYIQRIPLVTLYGSIKHSTKAKWDKILKDERMSEGEEVHDMTDDKMVIGHWDIDDLGPSCHCSQTCGARESKWFKEDEWSDERVCKDVTKKFNPED